MKLRSDVVIVGGGPAGSTVGTLIKKYNPRLSVTLFERESFPRDHVGESQLPLSSRILDEMGVWGKIEEAGFPIKIGATYRWGQTDELWDFEFVPGGRFDDAPRPGRYEGQRTQTAFQVDRAIYDKILLDHARQLGVEVHEESAVTKVATAGDRVTSLTVAHAGSEQQVTAENYVDASGHVGVLRRALGVEVETPTSLQNIAIWDYWQNADWAVKIGVGGTRVQVLSLGYGWIWFIPLGPTRTSIGLVVPAQYYKASSLRPESLYEQALGSDPVIRSLTKNATREHRLASTKDWSFLASRLAGENWFLAGESAGFADPILAAGMMLAHCGARDVAHTILELQYKIQDARWLRDRYSETTRRQIMQHIRFADFWYTHNGQFSDLKDFSRTLASDAGLTMSADEAWRWLGTGGFVTSYGTDVGTVSLGAGKILASNFTGEEVGYTIVGKSDFKLNLDGAEKIWGADVGNGRIRKHRSYLRGGKILPNDGICALLIRILKTEKTSDEIAQEITAHLAHLGVGQDQAAQIYYAALGVLEGMVLDGWVDARTVPGHKAWEPIPLDPTDFVHKNRDVSLTRSG